MKWYQKAAEKVVTPMPKLNWDKNTKTAKALNRALSSLPNGIEKQQSMFQTWVVQAKEGINWVSSDGGPGSFAGLRASVFLVQFERR